MRATISFIEGDGIGVDVCAAAVHIICKALNKVGVNKPNFQKISAGAAYYLENGIDIEPGGDEKAGKADAIFLGAIGLPNIRHKDGTEISPHLRLRDLYQLYAGVRPIKAYPNIISPLSHPKATEIDFVLIRESTEGLFYSAATHNRTSIQPNQIFDETLRVSRKTTEKLHNFAFKLTANRKKQGKKGQLTCVDKANVFKSMAFFRKIFDEVATKYTEVKASYEYVDAAALKLVISPWQFDVMVTENMFGDILSDLGGALVGGMGMAACGELGDEIGLFQPAHGSAPDIIDTDEANPLAAILSAALMLNYLSEKFDSQPYEDAALMIERSIHTGFESKRLRPLEFGHDMGTRAITRELSNIIDSQKAQ